MDIEKLLEQTNERLAEQNEQLAGQPGALWHHATARTPPAHRTGVAGVNDAR